MSILVIVDHANAALDPSTHGTVGAAAIIATFTGLDVHVLVAGRDGLGAAEAATRIAGVSKVILADGQDAILAVEKIAGDYLHFLAPATVRGKCLAMELAEKLGLAPIDAVTAILNAETIQQAIAAGRVSGVAPTSEATSVITVNVADFDEAAAEGGGAVLHKMDPRVMYLPQPLEFEEAQSSRTSVDFDKRSSNVLKHAAVFRALSNKLETAVSESRALHERIRLARQPCID
ncbi:hypothetical protein [Caballeronia novacaledonica]|uniref:Electron transfer flavoprotein alpha/beta-subunit N-terminal domain-containing protein n=1 Tax=Caballeronia novacaledonica TaxID=1544861 RepID=A0AA37MHM7_9BURK|nr:hypothetical protein [Caballeronia novacaledonica]GJH27075.1 hypothetical protein CBA19CS42_21185 [Caballeronia novacaledonica]